MSTVVAALLLTTACGDDETGRASDSAAGAATVDTTAATTALTPAAPAPQPTAEDAKVVRDALEFKLTEDNLNKFMKAGSSLAFLRARDPQIRGYLESIGGSREKNDDAALERLEGHAQISKAITDAGISVRDYYTMSLAIASAQRFIDNPSAAPPTPTLSDNAKFLRDHREHLAHLRVWGQ
ncbi:MAG: hypothetical protein ABR499_21755 [Gemmatimonadaceae bacterium]